MKFRKVAGTIGDIASVGVLLSAISGIVCFGLSGLKAFKPVEIPIIEAENVKKEETNND